MSNVPFFLKLLAVVVVAGWAATVRADDVELDLDYNSGDLTWELYAEVLATGGVDGGNGLSAIRALIDDIDFGTDGDAVNIAAGIGAIFPGGNQPVLVTTGGTIEILYGQDLSVPGSVVGGVGVGSRALIADGTYPSAGTPPSFGTDGLLTSESLFLNVAAPGPFGGSLDPDTMILNVNDVLSGFDPADFNMDGVVDSLDLGILLGNFGTTGTPETGELNGTAPVDSLDLGILLGSFGASPLAATAVPEPSTLVSLAGAILCGLAVRRRQPYGS